MTKLAQTRRSREPHSYLNYLDLSGINAQVVFQLGNPNDSTINKLSLKNSAFSCLEVPQLPKAEKKKCVFIVNDIFSKVYRQYKCNIWPH